MFLTAEICNDPNLNWVEKVLYTKIKNLEGEGVGCFASNAYLGSFLHMSEGHVSNMINGMIANGYLRREGGRRHRKLFTITKSYEEACGKPQLDRSLFHKNMEIEIPIPEIYGIRTIPIPEKSGIEPNPIPEIYGIEDPIPQKHGIETSSIPEIYGHSIRVYKDINNIYISLAERVYRKYFPDVQLDVFASETLSTLEVDEEVWDETVKHWAMNSYRPRRIFEMHQLYLDKLAKKPVPSGTSVVYCDDCKDMGGLIKSEGGLVKCTHKT
jgi:hypothetical protein